MSTAGGLSLAFKRIQQVKGQALQIFSKNQRQWATSPLTAHEISLFKQNWQLWGNFPIAIHDSYLINLANPKEEIIAKSIAAFREELIRAEQLAVPYVIMHPGSHVGSGVEAGLQQFVKNLDLSFKRAPGAEKVMVLIETTAGQGSNLGSRFEEIAFILEHSAYKDRLGVCLDTCHIFVAGYDFRTAETYDKTFTEFEQIIGFEKLRFFHLNDAKKELDSKVDRHEHIGQGKIGLAGFKLLLNDPRFINHPMTLETPKGKELLEDINNLAVLHKLLEAT